MAVFAKFGTNIIVPSRFHAPPRPDGASARICTEPRSTSTRFSFPSAKKPTNWLSGDQKGIDAPSVPGKGRPEADSRGRTHNFDCPSDVATNAIFSPSGEIAIDAESVVGGVEISTRISRAAGNGRKTHARATAATIVTVAKAETHTR